MQTIEVVRHNGELVFRTEGLLFDILDSHVLNFYSTEKLSVVRSGRVIGETSEIGWYGPRGDTCLFLGLEGVEPESPSFSKWPVRIRASKLEEGDVLLVECPSPLSRILPEYSQMLSSTVTHLKEAGSEGLTTDALNQAVDEDLKSSLVIPPGEVLRFDTHG